MRGLTARLGVVPLLLVLVAGTAHADERVWAPIYPGVRYSVWKSHGHPVHAVQIDLCAAGVSMRATAPEERGLTVSEFGARAHAQVAINGDFFREGMIPVGLAMSGGRIWDGSFDGSFDGFAAFGTGAARISLPRERVAAPPAWMSEVVSGTPALVAGGDAIERYTLPFCNIHHPRTAIGLTKDARTMYLLVVDGRAKETAGMTCAELALTMASLGVDRALNLDGGGSSTLWMDGIGLVNTPSEGEERPVATHLGIFAAGVGPALSCPDADQASWMACGLSVASSADVLPMWSEWSGAFIHEDRSGPLCGSGDRLLAGWDFAAP